MRAGGSTSMAMFSVLGTEDEGSPGLLKRFISHLESARGCPSNSRDGILRGAVCVDVSS